MARPVVDVVVPFRGSRQELEALSARVGRLGLRPGDTLVVVDNTPGREPGRDGSPRAGLGTPVEDGPEVRVLAAPGLATPAFARNQGVALGRADWLVFIDSDTVPDRDLLDRYFDVVPGDRTALLAGEVINEPVPAGGPAAARYAYLRGTMDQGFASGRGQWAFAISANMACRRSAFEAVGGFREDIRAGEDPDLSYRLRAAGWEIERREQAVVVHLGRRTTWATIAQIARWGAGDAWLERTHPGSRPPRRLPGLIWWAGRFATGGLARALLRRARDEAIRAVFDPLWELSYELGRRLPNERPLRPPWTRTRRGE